MIQLYNEEFIKIGSDQRMEEWRLIEISDGYEMPNLVEGGSIYTYFLIYELKPKYTDKFPEDLVIGVLSPDGWLVYELVDLIVYHENSITNSPYYLAGFVLDDGSTKSMTEEQFLAEIIKNEIPQLKLLNN